MLRALAARTLQRPALEFSTGLNAGRVHTIRPDTPLREALAKTARLRLGALVVAAGDDGSATLGQRASQVEPLGIFTERDVMEKLDFADKTLSLSSTTVCEFMTDKTSLQCATPEWTLEEALLAMHRGHFRHLPILDGTGHVLSMLSLRDVARALARAASVAASDTAASTAVRVDGEAVGPSPEDVGPSPEALARAAATTADDLAKAKARSVQITSPSLVRAGRGRKDLMEPASMTAQEISGGSPAVNVSCIEVAHNATVAEAVLEMRRWRAGSVLVPVEAGKTVGDSRSEFGIFTERDFVKMLGLHRRERDFSSRLDHMVDPRHVQVSRVMTGSDRLRTVEKAAPAWRCLESMGSEDVRHLPVMGSDGGLVAVLSMRDIVVRFLL
jgi:CBS domain-containing protein